MKGTSAKAVIITGPDGVTRIRHSEYIRDILPSTDFMLEPDLINPGNSNLFPWLSSIAPRYTTYKFTALAFRYEPATSTTLPGTVILSIDYNPDTAPPTSKTEALAMEDAQRTVPWECVSHVSSAANLNKRSSYYIRNDDSTSVIEPELYDVGLLSVIVQGVPTDVSPSIGELYVDYDLELRTPNLTPLGLSSSSSVVITSQSAVITGGYDWAFPFDSAIVYTPEGLEGLYEVGPFVNATATVGHGGTVGAIRFKQRGYYAVTISFLQTILGTAWDRTVLGYGTNGLIVKKLIPPFGSGILWYDDTTNGASGTFLIGYDPDNVLETGEFGIGFQTTLTGGGAYPLAATTLITPISQDLFESLLGVAHYRSRADRRVAQIKKSNRAKRERTTLGAVATPKPYLKTTSDCVHVDQTAKLSKHVSVGSISEGIVKLDLSERNSVEIQKGGQKISIQPSDGGGPLAGH